MATEQSSTPSFFNFLKEGLLLPSHNRRLFAAVFTVIAASTCLLLLGNDLAVQPLRDQLDQDKKALHSADPRTSSLADILQLIQKTKNDARALVLTSAAYSLFGAITKSAIQVVVVFAAVATYSGDKLLTFGSLLGKVKAQLKGPVLTLAFVYALEIAYVALLAAMSALLMFLKIKKYLGLLAVASLLFLVAVVFLLYFSFLCSMSVVVAVAEPGCHGAGALGRAWRLMKGKHRRAMLFVFVTALLAVALHYWNSVLCQLPKAVGKGPKTGGKGFADCFTRGSRQRTRGKEFVGKETFATCQEKSSRQSLCHLPVWQSAKGTNAVVR